MNDMVVGAITNYNFDQIKYWVNSLERCGYRGDKAMICYNIKKDTVDELLKRGFKIFGFEQNSLGDLAYSTKNFCIMLQRFIDMWQFLKDLKGKYRFLISTDVKDVVFQIDPTLYLEQVCDVNRHYHNYINVGSEGIKYEDEPWGKQNLKLSFGEALYEENKDHIIYNAGTIGGEFDAMLDFFKSIWLICGRSMSWVPGGGGPDQAAMNVLIQSIPYLYTTTFSTVSSGWCANLGTIANLDFKDVLLEKPPIIKDDMVCTAEGKPFCLVHQYDRYQEYSELIARKYA